MKKNSFIAGTFIATLSLIFVKILGMLYVVPFYAIVGTKGGALYSYAYNIYNIFLLISAAGIPSAISKIISEYDALGKYEAKNRAYKLAKKLIMLISTITFVMLFIFAEEIATLIIGDLKGGNTIEDVCFVIRCISFSVLLIPHLSVTKGYFQGHKYIGPSSVSNLIEQVVRITIILVGSYISLKVFKSSLPIAVGIAVSGAFFGGLVAYIYLSAKMRKHKSELNLDKTYRKDDISDKDIIKEIIKYAVPFIIINIIGSIYNFTDMILILRTLNHFNYSAEDVEFITSVISTWGPKISMIVNSMASGMSYALIPMIVSAYAVRNFKELNNHLNKALQIIIFVSLPMAIGLSILSTPVWTLFYNTNPYGGAILKIMIFNALLGNIAMISNSILQSSNRFKLVYLNNIIGSLINALLDVPLMILCHKIGIGAFYGAIFATSIGYIISIYISLHFIQKEDGFKLNYSNTFKTVSKIIIPAISMVVVLFIINKFLSLDIYTKIGSLIVVIINAIIGAVIYIGISYKMGIIEDIFGKEYMNKIIKKLTFGKFPKN